MTPKEFADKIARLLNVDPEASWNRSNLAAVILEIGQEKQRWNQQCNEACEKQVLKQIDAAYEKAAQIAIDFGCEDWTCQASNIAKQIRALKTT